MAIRTETLQKPNIREMIAYPIVHLEPVTQSQETRHNWLNWLNDPDINKWMYLDKPYTPPEIYRWIDRVVADPRRHYFSIISEDKPVGFVSLRQDQEPSDTAEIGIVIGQKDEQSKGIGTQTVQKILEFAKNETSVTSVRANIKPENEKSIRLFKSAGFVYTEDITVEDVRFLKFEKIIK